VNQLRQLMLEELQRRNFAATTIRTYLHGVAHFSRYFRRPPDQLGPEDIRKYQAMLFTKLKYIGDRFIPRYIWCATPMTLSSPAVANLSWSTKFYHWWKGSCASGVWNSQRKKLT